MPDLWLDVDAALSEVPVNVLPLLDDTDFKTREVAITYDQAGMDLVWNFVTTAGVYTQTAVTPTTAGNYDWTHQGDGMYSIEIPASGGVSINNDAEGFGWFTGFCTGVLPWRGPTIGLRASGLNDAMVDSAYSATRGLAGTALPAAAADAAGGLPISDAGGLDVDAILADTADMQPKLGTPAGASLAADLAAIEAQTDDIGAAGAGLTSIPDSAGTTTLLSRIPAALFAGLTSLAQWLGLIAGKQLGNATARTEVRATGAGTGTFDEATDSLEAVRDTAPLGTAMRGTDSAATASALATAQTDLDTLTGADGATLATAQANYAPSKAGDAMALTSGERTTLAAAIWNALTSGMTTVGSLGKKLADWVVGTIDTYTGNTKQTGDVGAAGAGLTAVPWNAAWDAEVQSEVADALDAAVPASPTANSLNERVKTMDDADLPANVPAAPPKNAEYTYVVKMVDATDLSTPETGLTVSMTRSLDGAAFGAATGTVTEISTGHYKVVASAADMNGNVVTHRFTATGAADLSVVYKTVS